MVDGRSQFAGTRRSPQAVPGRELISGNIPSFHRSVLPSFYSPNVPFPDPFARVGELNMRNKPNLWWAEWGITVVHRRGYDKKQRFRRQENKANSQWPVVRNKANSRVVARSRVARITCLVCVLPGSGVQKQSQFARDGRGAKCFLAKGLREKIRIMRRRKQSQFVLAEGMAGRACSTERSRSVVSNKAKSWGRWDLRVQERAQRTGRGSCLLGSGVPKRRMSPLGDAYRAVTCVRRDRCAAAPPRNRVVRDGVDLRKTFAGELYWGPNSRA